MGLAFEPGLVEAILDDVRLQPGGLPLLEHALLELWQRREGQLLAWTKYRETGAVKGAVAQRAEEIFSSLAPGNQVLAKRLFLRLVEPGQLAEDTRRRARLGELVPNPEQASRIEAIVKRLTDPRLLIADRDDGTGETLVEVAHKALIRSWPRLRRWVERRSPFDRLEAPSSHTGRRLDTPETRRGKPFAGSGTGGSGGMGVDPRRRTECVGTPIPDYQP